MSLRILALFGMLCMVSCGESVEQVPSHIFYGTLESTSVNASGHRAYLRLVGPDDDLDSDAYYITDCRMQGPACDFQINFVAEGEYMVFGFIDLNDDALVRDPKAGPGDLVSPGRPLLIFATTRMDFPDSAWHPMP